MRDHSSIEIAGKTVGAGNPAFIVAEVGINHNGDLDLAHKLVDGAADVGADAIKFQTIDANASYVPGTPSHEVFSGASLTLDQYKELARHCEERGIIFFTTPGDWPSLEICRNLSVPAIKISSGLMTNVPVLLEASRMQVPLVISTGGAYLWEIGQVVHRLEAVGMTDLALLHCVSIYPASDDKLNLKAIGAMQAAFPYTIGYSDHSLGKVAPLAAVTLGASLIEKHFTISKKLPGGDNFLSSEPAEFREMIQEIRNCEKMLKGGDKRPHLDEIEFRSGYRRRLVANQDISIGQELTSELVGLKRPLNPVGLGPEFFEKVIGRKATRKLYRHEPIQWDSITES